VTAPKQLILASGSPRRRQLLEMIGLSFEVLPADIDETEHVGESAVAYVERVAAEKAAAVAHRLTVAGSSRFVVLAADTTVDLDGSILAKPADDEDATRMLWTLSGRTHQVHTAVVGHTSSEIHTATVTTDVTFAQLSDQEIEWYLSMGEHLDKAGAYGMQTAGGALVERIDGSPTNVIGLPLAETIGVLRACGVAVVGGS
jgi:septum formation protein